MCKQNEDLMGLNNAPVPANPEANLAKDENLIDPMAFDSKEDLKNKKEDWMTIFYICPDVSNTILSIYEKYGEESMSILNKFINEKFEEYYEPFKEFFSEDNKDEE